MNSGFYIFITIVHAPSGLVTTAATQRSPPLGRLEAPAVIGWWEEKHSQACCRSSVNHDVHPQLCPQPITVLAGGIWNE